MKWKTLTKYVDQHTGEIIDKKEVEKNYIITKKYSTETRFYIEKNIQYGERTITRVCTNEGKQRTLFNS